MPRHVFAEQVESAIYHDPDEGAIVTNGGSRIEYRFDKSDGTVRLELKGGAWFWAEDLDYLIDALHGMKAALRR